MSEREQRDLVRTIQRAPLTSAQQLERIKAKLSPVDDDLPLAQAQRQKDDCDRAAKAFSKRQKRTGE